MGKAFYQPSRSVTRVGSKSRIGIKIQIIGLTELVEQIFIKLPRCMYASR